MMFSSTTVRCAARAFAFFLLAFAAMPVGAALIAYEPFNYTNGVRLSGQGSGTGWSGTWIESALNGTTDATIVSSNLATRGLTTLGGRMRTANTGNDVRDFRHLDTNNPALAPWQDSAGRFGKDGTTLWIAFTVRLAGGGNSGNGGIHLYDGLGNLAISADGDKANHERCFMGDRASGVNWFFGRTCGGCPCGQIFESAVVVDGTARLLVYRYEFTNSAVNVRLYIDPTPGVTPTNAPAVNATNLCGFAFDWVEVGSGGESIDLDEFRLATTYAEAAPPVPTLLTLTATNQLARLRLTGIVTQSYSFEATSDFVNWTNIGSAVTGTNGAAQFDDTNTAPFQNRFYRARLP